MTHNFRKLKIRELFDIQSGVCAYCKTPMTLELGYGNTATRDHVIPKSAMGKFTIKDSFNIVAACYDCNQRKSSKPLPIFLGELFSKREMK